MEGNCDDTVATTPVLTDIDLTVLTPSGDAIEINGLPVTEPVNTIKQLLMEYQSTAFYSNYALKAVGADYGDDSALLNDFTDISSYFMYLTTSEGDGAVSESKEEGKSEGPMVSARRLVLQIVDEEYDVKRARLHVKRTRDFIAFPPTIRSDSNSSVPETVEIADEVAEVAVVKKEGKFSGKNKLEKKEEKKEASSTIDKSVVGAIPDMSQLKDGDTGVSLGDFYGKAVFAVGTAHPLYSQKGLMKFPSQVIKSVNLSGWNPPPLPRKLVGDLLYIEVVTNDEGVFHITAIPSGFYVNKSSRAFFDPNPAAVAHFSHELFNTLMSVSTSLRLAWQKFTSTNLDSLAEGIQPGALDTIATTLVQGRADTLIQKWQWNSFAPPSDAALAGAVAHTYDLYRLEEELCDSYGMEEKGSCREWNEEIQQIRSMVATSIEEKILKAKLSHKAMTEYAEACKAVAVAIAEGHITPMNPTEPEPVHVFFYNNIFVSRAVDTKDSFKLCKGDEAAFKMAANDLNNSKRFQELASPLLKTALSGFVDYKGERFICQTMIPGVLQSGDTRALLVYGCLEQGKRLSCKKVALEAMTDVLAKVRITPRNVHAIPVSASDDDNKSKLSTQVVPQSILATESQPIRIDAVDEVAGPDDESMPHVGPLEAKLLKGSDDRIYALEIMRLTPRDANFVSASAGGTEVIDAATLAKVDPDVAFTYSIRSELIEQYLQYKVISSREAVLLNFAEEQKALREKGDDDSKLATADENLRSKMEALTIAATKIDVNPNVFLGFPCDVSPDVVAKDEQTARDLALHLWNTLLLTFTNSIRRGDVTPLDNESTISVMHAHGINVRYLGRLAQLAHAEEGEDRKCEEKGHLRIQAMPMFWLEMLEIEMIARAVKHILRSLFKNHKFIRHAPAPVIAAVLNAVFGTMTGAEKDAAKAVSTAADTSSGKKKDKKKKNKKAIKPLAPDSSEYAQATVPSVHLHTTHIDLSRTTIVQSIHDLVASKFCHELVLVQAAAASPETPSGLFHARISLPMLLRRICQQCCIKVASRDYDFQSDAPFTEAHVTGMVPRVRTCEPEVPLMEMRALLVNAAELLGTGDVQSAYELVNEASNWITSVTGPVHREAAMALDNMTTILLTCNDFPAALQVATKNLNINVHLYGLDSQEVMYTHIALFGIYEALRNYPRAIKHILAAKHLLVLAGGPRHPEIASLYRNLGQMYLEMGDNMTGLLCHVEAKMRSHDMSKVPPLLASIAQGLATNGNYQLALEEQQQCHRYLSQMAGDDNERTKEAEAQVKVYTRLVVEEKVRLAKASQTEQAALIEAKLRELTNKLGRGAIIVDSQAAQAGKKGSGGGKGGKRLKK